MDRLHLIKIIKARNLAGIRNLLTTQKSKSSSATDDLLVTDYNEQKIIELTKSLVSETDFLSYTSECKYLASEYRKNKSERVPVFRRHVYAQVAALAIMVAAVFIYTHDTANIYETKIGEQRTIVLKDNSRINLNTDTSIRVQYSQESRTIWMEKGEAYFVVSHNPKRPFLVKARNGTVRAVGTAFNVGIRDDVISVAVLEGSVNVVTKNELSGEAQAEGQARLKVGESVKYWSNGIISNVEFAEDNRINAWREGKLRFKDVNLVDAIAEHNRYTARKIVLGSDNLRFLSVNGVFNIGDTKSFLFLLEGSLGLEIVIRPDVIVLFPKKQSMLVTDALLSR